MTGFAGIAENLKAVLGHAKKTLLTMQVDKLAQAKAKLAEAIVEYDNDAKQFLLEPCATAIADAKSMMGRASVTLAEHEFASMFSKAGANKVDVHGMVQKHQTNIRKDGGDFSQVQVALRKRADLALQFR